MSPRIAALVSAVIVGTAWWDAAAYGALPQAHPGPTVNDYTAEQSARAEAAAQKAGFNNLGITMVQAGNFFLNGEKQGQTYSLTVTPEGKVYPSTPLSSAGG
jgi:hypothetical protein